MIGDFLSSPGDPARPWEGTISKSSKIVFLQTQNDDWLFMILCGLTYFSGKKPPYDYGYA